MNVQYDYRHDASLQVTGISHQSSSCPVMNLGMRTDEMNSTSCDSSSHRHSLSVVSGVGREEFEGTAKAIGMICGSVETRGSRTHFDYGVYWTRSLMSASSLNSCSLR